MRLFLAHDDSVGAAYRLQQLAVVVQAPQLCSSQLPILHQPAHCTAAPVAHPCINSLQLLCIVVYVLWTYTYATVCVTMYAIMMPCL